MRFSKIAVLGLGKVGALAAVLLHDAGFEVVGCDSREPRNQWPFARKWLDVSSAAALDEALKPFAAVLSCLPNHCPEVY